MYILNISMYIFIFLHKNSYQHKLLKHRRSIFTEKKNSQGVISNIPNI